MPFSLVSDVLTDPRGKTYNVFNQHSKQDRLKKNNTKIHYRNKSISF